MGTLSRSATTAVSVQWSRGLLGGEAASGNVHSAEDWDELLLPEIERQQAGASKLLSGRMRLCQAGDL